MWLRPSPDPQIPKCLIYYIESVQETPLSIALLTGDILFNLRAALDHLAFQLVLANGCTPTKQTYFPISDDATKYKTEAPRKVRGMSPAAIKAIDEVKPYEGGNDRLWQLHRLNAIDKHRVLVTVGSSIAYHSFPQILTRGLIEAIRDQQPVPTEWDLIIARQGYGGLTMRPVDRQCPLKAGDELVLSFAPILDIDEKMQIAFEIAINEPPIIESEPLLPTLMEMTDRTNDLIFNFKSLLG